jgi:hypothetical protein
VPVGVAPPEPVVLTVTVHVEGASIGRAAGVQSTAVDVGRLVAVTVLPPLVATCDVPV